MTTEERLHFFIYGFFGVVAIFFIFLFIFTFWEDRGCRKCGGKLGPKKTFNRAYNSLCKQAAGAWGRYCDKCSKVNWDEPDEEKWFETQPVWVVPYDALRKDPIKYNKGLIIYRNTDATKKSNETNL